MDVEHAHEEDSFLEQDYAEPSSRRKRTSLPCWAWVVFVVLALSNIIQFFHIGRPNWREISSYDSGFDTELPAVRPHISIIQRSFSGGIIADENGTFFRDVDETQPQYVGKPSKHIDDAWSKLLDALNLDLRGPSANGMQDQTYRWQDEDAWLSGLEVFHSLHCLNMIRRAVHPEYYRLMHDPEQPPPDVHIDHCIDHIRQLIQCHADLTPMNWELRGSGIILKTDTLRTCRDFDQIKTWAGEQPRDYTAKKELVDGSRYIVD